MAETVTLQRPDGATSYEDAQGRRWLLVDPQAWAGVQRVTAERDAALALLARWHKVCAQSCGGSEDVAYAAADQLIGEGE